MFSKTLDKFYIGYTSNIKDRIIRHNQKSKGFTGNVSDWVIVYLEEFNTKKAALFREKQIKSWKSREMIKKLIDSSHPDL